MRPLSHELSIELKRRRSRLLDEMPVSSVAILPAANMQFRNRDTEYPFRQNSNFYYLTGFCEPDAVMVLTKEDDGSVEFILFCKPLDANAERWSGPRAGLEGACQQFGATQSFEQVELDVRMPMLLSGKEQFFYSFGVDPAFDRRMLNWVTVLRSKSRVAAIPQAWIDLNSMIHAGRIKKSPYEITLLRQAAVISSNAHVQLMQSCTSHRHEYELEAKFWSVCRAMGAQAMAYPPIVGSGANACILHYTYNDQPLTDGDLVLVDAGCEYRYYASDITRTFPVNGRFTSEQRSIYELVLKAQEAAIREIRPGVPWNKPQTMILQVLVEGLVSLGLLIGPVDTLIETKAYEKFYMHNSGHWLGLDVHDVGEYQKQGQSMPLEPGMVLTVEPGLYIAKNQLDIDQKWWGIGVRIEDDVLVTESGHEILSHAVPKTVDAIEHLMNESKSRK